jgi:hypothetical protein
VSIIAAKRGRSPEPRISVTGRPDSIQVRVAFNPAVVEKMGLSDFGFVALDHDEPKRRLRFIPSAATYSGAAAHRLLSDGGKATASRILLVPTKAIPFLPKGHYTPHFRGKVFEIFYEVA